MNSPRLASERRELVEQAKKRGVSKDDAWSTIQHEWTDMRFEGHHLYATIERVYDD